MRRIERFDNYMSTKGLNDNIVTNNLGLSIGTIGKSRKEGRDLSDRVIELILNFYTDLNRVWLLTGEGEMLKGEVQYVEYEEVKEERRLVNVAMFSENDEIEVDLEGLMDEVNASPRDIATIICEEAIFVASYSGKLRPRHIIALQKRYGNDLVDKYAKYPKQYKAEIIEAIPVVSDAVTADPDTNVKKYVEENSSELETIDPTRILFDFKVDVAEEIKRTSMLPTFQPNDYVFIRFIEDKEKIVDGETYYFDCKRRPTMIRMVKFEGEDKLRLVAKNAQYGDIIINRCDINNIGKVVAVFRMTFGDQYSELEALRRQKDEEREKKDAQIDKMLEMMQSQEAQQSKLIDFICREK